MTVSRSGFTHTCSSRPCSAASSRSCDRPTSTRRTRASPSTVLMFGGYFFLYPMALAVLGIVIGRVRAQLKEQRLLPLFVALVCVAFALCIFDLQGAGILMRYVCDFGLFFALAGAIVFLCASAGQERKAPHERLDDAILCHRLARGCRGGGRGRRNRIGVPYLAVLHVRDACAHGDHERDALECFRHVLMSARPPLFLAWFRHFACIPLHIPLEGI